MQEYGKWVRFYHGKLWHAVLPGNKWTKCHQRVWGVEEEKQTLHVSIYTCDRCMD
jgi:hypothetical protein